MNWRGTSISQMAISRCPATTLIPPQPSGVPPDFDRFPPPWLAQAHTPQLRLRQRADAALASGVRGSSTTMPLTPKRSKSGASLTRCRSQSPRRRCAALLGRTAVPTVAGGILLRVGPRTKVWWQGHGALVAPYEGIFPCRRKNILLIKSAPHCVWASGLIRKFRSADQSRRRSRSRPVASARPGLAPLQSSRMAKPEQDIVTQHRPLFQRSEFDGTILQFGIPFVSRASRSRSPKPSKARKCCSSWPRARGKHRGFFVSLASWPGRILRC